MYREDGETVWTCELNSYGKVRNFQGESKTMCPFRYQGQYEDAETGLYYNRFRYYSPEEGFYLNQDPIRLLGGTELYGYVQNTCWGVDPFGLKGKNPNVTRGNNGEPLTATATVTLSDIGQGSTTSQSSRDYARSQGKPTDDAGHILGKNLGGQGQLKLFIL
jgi:RHS repeat-associated protein